MKTLFSIILLLFTIGAFGQVDEKKLPNPPNPPKLVNDFGEILTEEQEHELERKLVAYDDSTSSQIAIVTVKSLMGYEDEEFAIALGRKWKVGGSDFNNGIIILIGVEDRKIRIEVGYGLEGAIPDITAKHIIENSITPSFKEQQYYRGLDHAVDDIIKAAAGEYKATKKKTGKAKGIGFGLLVVIIILVSLFAGGRGGGGGMVSRRGYRDIGTGMLLGTLLGGGRSGGSGWSGGGGGGGGFGGFGGGSFGGGGASGSW